MTNYNLHWRDLAEKDLIAIQQELGESHPEGQLLMQALNLQIEHFKETGEDPAGGQYGQYKSISARVSWMPYVIYLIVRWVGNMNEHDVLHAHLLKSKKRLRGTPPAPSQAWETAFRRDGFSPVDFLPPQ